MEKTECLEGCGQSFTETGMRSHLYWKHGVRKNKQTSATSIPKTDPISVDKEKQLKEAYSGSGQKETTEEEKEDQQDRKRIELISKRPIYLSGEALARAEALINAGFAGNLSELGDKLLKLATELSKTEGLTEVEEMAEGKKESEDSFIKDFKEIAGIKKQEALLRAYENVGGGTNKKETGEGQKAPIKSKSEMIQFLTDQAEIQALTKMMSKDSEFNMKDMMQLMMLQNLIGASTNKAPVQDTALQQQLASLQNQLQQQRMEFERSIRDKEVTTAIQQIKDEIRTKKDIDPEAIVRMFSDKFEAVEKQKMETQKERDARKDLEQKNLITEMRNEIQHKMQGTSLSEAIKQKIEDQIIESIDFNKIMDKKENTWDKALTIFQPTIDKVADIIINEQNKSILESQQRAGAPVHYPGQEQAQDTEASANEPQEGSFPSPPELTPEGFKLSLGTEPKTDSFFTKPKKSSFFPSSPRE